MPFKNEVFVTALLFCSTVLILHGLAVAQPASSTKQAKSKNQSPRADLVVVADNPPWLVSLTTPALSKLTRTNVPPSMLVVGTNPGKGITRFVNRLDARRLLLIWPHQSQTPDLGLRAATVVRTDQRPLAASLRLARRFWKTSDQVVVTSLDDRVAVVMASSLAARLALPLILYDSTSRPAELSDAFERLRTKRLLICEAATQARPRWSKIVTQRIERVNTAAVHARIIKELGASKIRNLVVTRAPDEETGVGQSAWLAPYLALKRRAVPVITESSRATAAEDLVNELIATYRLHPRTVTILADYHSIGTNNVLIRSRHGGENYEIETEPCVPTNFDAVATVGVGRIPFRSREDASLLLARGFSRKKLLGDATPQAVMLANPSGGLKLCETVSRSTAAELKNADVQVDEFYETPSNSPAARTAAKKAHLIVFEGHVNRQRLFDDPKFFMDEDIAPGPDVDDDPQILLNEDFQALRLPRTQSAEQTLIQVLAPPRSYDALEGRDDPIIGEPCGQLRNEMPAPIEDDDLPPLLERDEPLEHVDGLPVVVLQGCRSLADPMFRRIHQCGGVMMVGSVTRIHSASGSAFIKAFIDNSLYRNSTLGEALRDARNYFFCLHDLKNLRGHREQSKSQRVALSFRIWGDPELRLFPQPLPKPVRRLVSAKWDDNANLTIKVPVNRIQTSRTDQYFVRMYAGSQVAGMVKKVKQRTARRLTPIYFFRLPAPDGFRDQQFELLNRPDDKPNRAVFRCDPSGRYVYVLYYPEKETRNEKFTLEFSKCGQVGTENN